LENGMENNVPVLHGSNCHFEDNIHDLNGSRIVGITCNFAGAKVILSPLPINWQRIFWPLFKVLCRSFRGRCSWPWWKPSLRG
jgi:hypothetical protein